jgi:hypothetical protein
MNASAFTKLNRQQYHWFFLAYWRIWWVQIKLKFGGPAWLTSQLHLDSDNLDSDNLDSACGGANQSGATTAKVREQQLICAVLMHEAVRLAARCHFWRAACLPKSIVLADMLNAGHGVLGSSAKRAIRSSKPARVRIGVQQVLVNRPQFASHAWVELDGQMLAEPDSVDEQFQKVFRNL